MFYVQKDLNIKAWKLREKRILSEVQWSFS